MLQARTRRFNYRIYYDKFGHHDSQAQLPQYAGLAGSKTPTTDRGRVGAGSTIGLSGRDLAHRFPAYRIDAGCQHRIGESENKPAEY